MSNKMIIDGGYRYQASLKRPALLLDDPGCSNAHTVCHLYEVGNPFEAVTLYLFLMCVYVLGCDSDLHSFFALIVKIILRLSSKLIMCN